MAEDNDDRRNGDPAMTDLPDPPPSGVVAAANIDTLEKHSSNPMFLSSYREVLKQLVPALRSNPRQFATRSVLATFGPTDHSVHDLEPNGRLRNILLLLPILFTWLSLGLSLRAWDSTGSDDSFISYWVAEEGFLPPSLPVTAFVTAGVILMALLVGARMDRPMRYSVKRSISEVESALMSIDLTLGLSPSRAESFDSAQSAALSLSSAAAQLDRAATRIDSWSAGVPDMTAWTTQWQSATEAFIEQFSVLPIASQQFATSLTRLEQLSDSIARRAELLDGGIEADAKQFRLIADGVRQTISELHAAVADLGFTSEVIRREALGFSYEASAFRQLRDVEADELGPPNGS